MEIEEFSLKLVASKPLLSNIYRNFLNPLEIEVVGATDMPVLTDK